VPFSLREKVAKGRMRGNVMKRNLGYSGDMYFVTCPRNNPNNRYSGTKINILVFCGTKD